MRLYRAVTPRLLNPLIKHVRSRLIVKAALHRVYGKRAHFTERDVEEFLAPSQFPDYALALRELLHSYDWMAAQGRKLATLDLPAVGVWGTRDHMMPADGMRIYLGLLPRIVLHAIPEAGHIIPQETPAEVNSALVDLLSETAPLSGA
jgi:pimeloyl-ACP methyl ester carboxylesterase